MIESRDNFSTVTALAETTKMNFSKCIIGIYAIESKRKNQNQESLAQEGSGFLVKSKDKVFIFTELLNYQKENLTTMC
jgi:hypothetical protein